MGVFLLIKKLPDLISCETGLGIMELPCATTTAGTNNSAAYSKIDFIDRIVF
jgi:hypothetical protein